MADLGRVVGLMGYYPEYLQAIRELQEITQAERPELEALYQKLDGVWADGFISTASPTGVKRWEGLLKISTYPGDTLEERRSEVMGRWIRQLPYTLESLEDTLTAAVGVQHYELLLRPDQYEMDLYLLDQALRTMQGIREIVKTMIPANILLLICVKTQEAVNETIKITARMALLSEFYPRENRIPLILDGTWPLDGRYLLGGYREGETVDFYPMALTVKGENPVFFQDKLPPVGVSIVYQMTAGLPEPPRSKVFLRVGNGVREQVKWKSDALIRTELKADITKKVSLTVEKDLWCLDGGECLDGNRILDADILTFDL